MATYILSISAFFSYQETESEVAEGIVAQTLADAELELIQAFGTFQTIQEDSWVTDEDGDEFQAQARVELQFDQPVDDAQVRSLFAGDDSVTIL